MSKSQVRTTMLGTTLGMVGAAMFALSCGGYAQPHPFNGSDGGTNSGDAQIDGGPDSKDITAFSFLKANNPGLALDTVATISGTSITAKLPLGQPLTSLVATFATSGASVKIASTTQTSGTTVNDFSSPLTYIVTAPDGTAKTYTVTTSARTFATHVDFTVGAGPTTILLADFNGDGKPDIAVSDVGSNDADSSQQLSVLLNLTATGASLPSFSSDVEYGEQIGDYLAAGDMNGDTKPDIIANSDGRSIDFILNGNAMGATTPTFTETGGVPPGGQGGGIVISDFNKDGLDDYAVARGAGSSVSVFINATTADATTLAFQTVVPVATSTLPAGMVATDLNNDGKPDLAVVDLGSIGVSILLNETTATATLASFAADQPINVGASTSGIAAADFNGDNKVDLAVVNPGTNAVSVVLNQTTAGSFTSAFSDNSPFDVGSGAVGVAAGDLDGDGVADLVVANSGGSNVSVLLNKTSKNATSPSFATQLPFNTGTGPQYVAIGDINGDGFPDLVVSNSGTNTVSVLLSE